GDGFPRNRELASYQLAREFKLAVYRILRNHPEACKDLKFSSQLRDAARSSESNVAEGWRRFGVGEMSQFLRVALASNEEAKVRLRDGIDCEYFTETECETAFQLGRRAGAAIMALLKSLQRLPQPKRPRPKAAKERLDEGATESG